MSQGKYLQQSPRTFDDGLLVAQNEDEVARFPCDGKG